MQNGTANRTEFVGTAENCRIRRRIGESWVNPSTRRPEPAMRTTTLRFDSLEARDVPAVINWTNDGVNDHFGEVFGAQAGDARAVVRAAIDAWENVISDFHNQNGNALDLTIRMATDQDVDDFGFGGNTDRIAGQVPPGEVELD